MVKDGVARRALTNTNIAGRGRLGCGLGAEQAEHEAAADLPMRVGDARLAQATQNEPAAPFASLGELLDLRVGHARVEHVAPDGLDLQRAFAIGANFAGGHFEDSIASSHAFIPSSRGQLSLPARYALYHRAVVVS